MIKKRRGEWMKIPLAGFFVFLFFCMSCVQALALDSGRLADVSLDKEDFLDWNKSFGNVLASSDSLHKINLEIDKSKFWDVCFIAEGYELPLCMKSYPSGKIKYRVLDDGRIKFGVDVADIHLWDDVLLEFSANPLDRGFRLDKKDLVASGLDFKEEGLVIRILNPGKTDGWIDPTLGLLDVVIDECYNYTLAESGVKMSICLNASSIYSYDVLSGTEQNIFYDNGSLIEPNWDDSFIEAVLKNDTSTVIYRGNETVNESLLFSEDEINDLPVNKSLAGRKTFYYDDIMISIDYYEFQGQTDTIELHPVYHHMKIWNATGYDYNYKVTNLIYDGEDYNITTRHHNFGNQIAVLLDYGYIKGNVSNDTLIASWNLIDKIECSEYWYNETDFNYECIDWTNTSLQIIKNKLFDPIINGSLTYWLDTSFETADNYTAGVNLRDSFDTNTNVSWQNGATGTDNEPTVTTTPCRTGSQCLTIREDNTGTSSAYFVPSGNGIGSSDKINISCWFREGRGGTTEIVGWIVNVGINDSGYQSTKPSLRFWSDRVRLWNGTDLGVGNISYIDNVYKQFSIVIDQANDDLLLYEGETLKDNMTIDDFNVSYINFGSLASATSYLDDCIVVSEASEINTLPNVSSALPNSNYSFHSPLIQYFNITPTDEDNDGINCSLVIDGSVSVSSGFVSNGTFIKLNHTFSSLDLGLNSFNFMCCDNSTLAGGNCANSTTYYANLTDNTQTVNYESLTPDNNVDVYADTWTIYGNCTDVDVDDDLWLGFNVDGINLANSTKVNGTIRANYTVDNRSYQLHNYSITCYSDYASVNTSLRNITTIMEHQSMVLDESASDALTFNLTETNNTEYNYSIGLVDGDHTFNVSAGSTQFTVDGLLSGVTYNITLVPVSNAGFNGTKISVSANTAGEASIPQKYLDAIMEANETANKIWKEVKAMNAIIMLAAVFALLCFLMVWMDDEHYPLKILFMFLMLFLSVLGVRFAVMIVSGDTDANLAALLNGAYLGFFWCIVFAVFWYSIYFISRVLGWLQKINWDKKFKRPKEDRKRQSFEGI